MIDDCASYKIIHHSYGSCYVHDCTIENALTILGAHLDYLGQDIKDVVSAIGDREKYVVDTENSARAIEEMLNAKLGDVLPLSTLLVHGTPVAGIANEQIVFDDRKWSELMKWAAQNDVHWQNIGVLPSDVRYRLSEMSPENFFLFERLIQKADTRKIVFVNSSTLETADELLTLQKNRWKDSAKVSSVVQRYLNFTTDYLTGRNEKYELAFYSEKP